MSRVAVKILLSPAEREQLEKNVHSHSVEHRVHLRSQIILLAAEGQECIAIAKKLGISEKTCRKWRNRFASERMAGLLDLQRSGAPEILTPEERHEIIRMACTAPKEIENWTLAELTERVRHRFGKSISVETVRMILKSADEESVGAGRNHSHKKYAGMKR